MTDPTTETDESSAASLIGLGIGLIVAVVLAVAATVVAGPVLLLLALSSGATSTDTDNQTGCGNVAEIKILSDRQTDMARKIYHATIRITDNDLWSTVDQNRAAVIALATAMQESSLGSGRNWNTPNRDGDAGLYQQRTLPGWYGTPQEVSDPDQATEWFLMGRTISSKAVAEAKDAGVTPAGPAGYQIPGLKQIQDWQELPITEAAQQVQRSAHPHAYAAHEELATTLVAAFSGDGSCTNTSNETTDCTPSESAEQLLRNQGTKLTPDAHITVSCTSAQFPQILTWGAIGDRPSTVDRDHQEGRALDAMIPGWDTPEGKALGDEIAEWLVTNHTQLGVKYIIWNARIWSTTRPDQGWLTCGQGGHCYSGTDATQAHRDHVHISVHGNTAQPHKNDDRGADRSSGTIQLPVDQFTLTARFGQCGQQWQRCHTGLDFAAPLGTPVHTIADGTVTYAGLGGAYGNIVHIDHGSFESWYAHLVRMDVKVGQTVTAGETIGAVGATGNVTGPHLHLEIRPGGSGGLPVNPYTWLTNKGLKL